MNTICVYTICKNEIKFVERWYNSVKTADYVVVLDTGSTDGTQEKMRELGVEVYEETITPWRFDNARNASMKYLPQADIYFCVDIDEVLSEGWADILRERWNPRVHTRGSYKVMCGEGSQPSSCNWIHNGDWEWIYPCHEAMIRKSNNLIWYYPSETCELYDCITLNHLQDFSKGRTSYLDLLKIRFEEFQTNPDSALYLIREYIIQRQWKAASESARKVIRNWNIDNWTREQKSALYYYLGYSAEKLNREVEAVAAFYNAIAADNRYREGYIELASILIDNKCYDEALSVLLDCKKNSIYLTNRTWFNKDDLWTYKLDDWLGIAYYWVGNKEKALYYTEKAYDISKSERIKNNIEWCKKL